MINLIYHFGPKENRLCYRERSDEYLDHFGTFGTTKESTLDVVTGVPKGVLQILTGKFRKGFGNLFEAVGNGLDALTAPVFDFTRSIANPKHQYGPSPYRYNLSRAAGEFEQIEFTKPIDAIGQVAAGTFATVQALFTRGFSDLARLVKNSDSTPALATT